MSFLPWEIAGAAVALGGQTMAAVGEYKSQMFNAKLTRENADLKGLARKEMGYRALRNLQKTRLENEQMVGQQVARTGGSGVDVGDSTSLEIRQNQEQIYDRNRDNAIREHSFEAKKSMTEERHLYQQSDMMKKTAKITLASNLLIAAGNAAMGVGGSIHRDSG